MKCASDVLDLEYLLLHLEEHKETFFEMSANSGTFPFEIGQLIKH